MTKIVFNNCYGGFGLSEKATLRVAELKGIKLYTERQNGWLNHYYTVPVEEYKRMKAEDDKNRNWDRSNALYYTDRSIERDDPILVQMVEELGDEANGYCASLEIAEVTAGTAYRIDEYDGSESVMTSNDYDWKIAR